MPCRTCRIAVGDLSVNPPNQMADKWQTKGRQAWAVSGSPLEIYQSGFSFFNRTMAHFFGSSSGNTPISSGIVREGFGKRGFSSGNLRLSPNRSWSHAKELRVKTGRAPGLSCLLSPVWHSFVCHQAWTKPPNLWFVTLHFADLPGKFRQIPANSGKNFSGFLFLSRFVLYRYLIIFLTLKI